MNVLDHLFKPNVAKLEQKRDIRGLVKAIQHPDQAIRYASTCALLRLGAIKELVQMGPAATKLLAQTFKSSDESIRRAAIATLSQIGHPSAVEPLLAVLRVDQEMRQAAAKALDELDWKPETDLMASLYFIAKREWHECVHIGPPSVEPLVAVLRDADGDVRHGAAQALVQIGQPSVVPLVIALQDSNRHLRHAATQALVQIGQPSVEPLVAALQDSRLRPVATQILVKIGPPSVEPLVAVLQDSGLRHVATQMLVKIGPPSVESLVTALQDSNGNVRQAATEALDGLGWESETDLMASLYFIAKREWHECVHIGPPSVEPLIAALEDANGDVRQGAVRALGQIGDVRAVEPLHAVRKDADSNVRQAAVHALEQISRCRAVESHIAILKGTDSGLRRVAVQVLGQVGGSRAVELLIAALEDAECSVRQAVAQVLGQIGGRRAVEPLVATLEDSDGSVRQAAAEALDELGWKPGTVLAGCLYLIAKCKWHTCVRIGQPSVEPLIAVLNDAECSVRQAVAQALGQIGDARAVEPLITVVLEDKSWEVRHVAAQALGQIGDARAVEPLIAVLQDKNPEVRHAVTRALGPVGGSRVVEPLIAVVLKDENREVRQAAVQALGQIGDARAVKPLAIAVFKDENREVRLAAIQGLGQINDTRAVEPLIAILQDKSQEVRQAAAKALVQIGEPSVEPLIAVLEDADSDVCQTVTEALGQIGDNRAVEPLIAASMRHAHIQVPWDIGETLKHFDPVKVDTALTQFRGEGLVVCIDDSAQVRATFKTFLETKGFMVLLAADGIRGLELVRLVKPDLVLLDLEMPGVDGRQVYHWIKAADDLQLKHIPVLIVSASTPHIDEGLGRNVDGWLSKPVTRSGLLEAVERVLKGREWE